MNFIPKKKKTFALKRRKEGRQEGSTVNTQYLWVRKSPRFLCREE